MSALALRNKLSFPSYLNVCLPEDCLWVLRCSPSLLLLQLLAAPQQARPAVWSVGALCSSLLSDPQQQDLALQLLDSFVSGGPGASTYRQPGSIKPVGTLSVYF